MANNFTPENANIFACESCDFICSKASDYNRHLATLKHKNANNANYSTAVYACGICAKVFKHVSSLSRHKKKCTVFIKNEKKKKPTNLSEPKLVDVLLKENADFKNVILDFMKSNQELQKQMFDVCKNSVNNNTINSHNKTFNMQFFLNEQCKDAMNLKDFVDTFQLQFSDLENVGKLGYVEGISDIIIKKLNELDIHKRPIHCSDFKRDIVYVKTDNVWTKEDSNHPKLRQAIKHISKKNMDMVCDWSKANPNSQNCDHYLNDVYLNIVSQSMGLRGGGIEENENKIIKKISKMVLIDR